MNKIISLFIKHYKIFILVIILLLIEAYFTLALPQYTGNIVDIGIKNANMPYIYDTGKSMIIATLLASISLILVYLFSNRLAAEFAGDLRKNILSRALEFSNHELNEISKSSLITRTTHDVTNIQNFTRLLLTNIAYAPILGMGGIIKTIQLGIDLYWIVVLVLLVTIISLVLILAKVLPKFAKLQKIRDNINRHAREMLTGIPIIKTFVRQDYERNKFEKTNAYFKDTEIYTNKYYNLIYPILTLVMSLMVVGIIFHGSYEVQAGTLLTGDLVAFIQYATQITSSILLIINSLIMLPNFIVSFKRVTDIFNTEITIKEGDIETIDNDESIIEFKNVSFQYPQSEKDVLTNINFKLEPGKTTAIIGGTGSGKSTILSLIPRLQDPSSGEILLNGENIKNFKLNALRNQISLSPQKAKLFTGTIRTNINLTDENASDDDIKEALTNANVNFINGLDDEVTQDGSNFSGGQKQRISIARTMLKKCGFYIFDDCFSALDMNTEKAIKNNLNYLNDASILIVSQRISTIQDADEILVLDKGMIVDRGRHDELVKSSRIYQEILESQQSTLQGGI